MPALDFESLVWSHGLLADLRDGPFPTTVSAWRSARLRFDETGTHFGFVQEGEARLEYQGKTFEMSPGMYFAVPGEGSVRGSGCGIVVARIGFHGFFQVGGPIEDVGRLRYIDGCSDSLLIAPIIKGDPCLNLLYIPAGTNQTFHTHPSIRVGIVVRGHGVCDTSAGAAPLAPGNLFVIRADGLHRFRTENEALTVIAYHPDSDFGPTHEDHPMLNRTIIEEPAPNKQPAPGSEGDRQ